MSSANCNVVVGIDVGGRRKGFHAVSLCGNTILETRALEDAEAIAIWCQTRGAVGIDAPCKWSATGRARAAERELMSDGIGCFSTPTKAVAKSHPADHFGWMINGMALHTALSVEYPSFGGTPVNTTKVSFETFPHAIACSLTGSRPPARKKNRVRPGLLNQCGIDDDELKNIDFVDAALCAVTAQRLLESRIRSYGSADEGFIVVPLPGGAALWRWPEFGVYLGYKTQSRSELSSSTKA